MAAFCYWIFSDCLKNIPTQSSELAGFFLWKKYECHRKRKEPHGQSIWPVRRRIVGVTCLSCSPVRQGLRFSATQKNSIVAQSWLAECGCFVGCDHCQTILNNYRMNGFIGKSRYSLCSYGNIYGQNQYRRV